jgi:hypothetical protein
VFAASDSIVRTRWPAGSTSVSCTSPSRHGNLRSSRPASARRSKATNRTRAPALGSPMQVALTAAGYREPYDWTSTNVPIGVYW